jgi:hypothetical protein
VIAGAAGLTAAFAGMAAALAPGHTLGAKGRPASTAATGHVSGNGTPVMPPLADPATLGLQGAGAAPSPSASSSSSQAAAAAAAAAVTPAPAVVSGGS